MGEAIVVDGLTKTYGPLHAVDGVDFRVETGTVFAFLGPNGAGKTTTTEILEGVRQRSEGEVRVLGLDPWSDGARLHRRIGVIPQEFHFLERITPREAIEYYATLFAIPTDASALLERVHLADKADARFMTLSGGQKQKVGLALSLVNNPEVCFLDEPTTGLDPQARRAIWEVIRGLRADGRTVFLTTHYLEEAELLADRVAIIHHGKVVAEGAPASIIERLGGPMRLHVNAPPELAQYLRGRFPNDVRTGPGFVEIALRAQSETLPILTAIDQSGLPWSNLSTVRDTLEDVFVRLVGRMDDGVLKSSTSAAPEVPA